MLPRPLHPIRGVRHMALLAASLLLAGCAAPPSVQATPAPSATSPEVSAVVETPTPEPTLTAEPDATEAPLPEHADTVTPEATASGPAEHATQDATEAPPPVPTHPSIPDAAIRILRPGNLSRVATPLRLVVDVPPGPEGRVQVDLVGEDGRLLGRKIVYLAVPPGTDRNTMILEFDFEVRGVAETGRIEISVLDEFGRLKHFASNDLILLASGRADIRFPTTQSERLYIEEPGERAIISGGALVVSGHIRDLGDQPLVLELVSEEGRILATGLAAVTAAGPGEYGLFVGGLNYTVSEPTWVRLLVRARGVRIPGNAYVSSVVLLLNP